MFRWIYEYSVRISFSYSVCIITAEKQQRMSRVTVSEFNKQKFGTCRMKKPDVKIFFTYLIQDVLERVHEECFYLKQLFLKEICLLYL